MHARLACRALRRIEAVLGILLAVQFSSCLALADKAGSKQRSLDEWRSLTAASAAPPKMFIKGDRARFFFTTDTGVQAFSANWSRLRVPTSGYKPYSALLKLEQKLPRMPEAEHGWREATVIAGAEWRRFATNLVAELTPGTPAHGAYYQAFLADRLLYRDSSGVARSAPLGEPPPGVVIEHRFSMDETLELLARLMDRELSRTHPGDSLFLVMAPNARRFTQPLLIDRRERTCVVFAPAALYDWVERGSSFAVTAQGLSALLPESHGWALLKNPISSAARLCDLGVATLVRFIRLPLPKTTTREAVTTDRLGMDLTAWEGWLDRYTGTRRVPGSIRLLIDGDGFFPRFQEAILGATNRINLNVYIFDRDDVAVQVADALKHRSAEIEVKVILDRVGSIAAGVLPPATPLPEGFIAPSSITSYLKEDSRVKVRPFLNPWLSSDHGKVLLVDGAQAWLGGMNLGREYRYEWHDLMVELQGPVVANLEADFRRAWAHAGPLGDLAYFASLFQTQPAAPATSATNDWIALRLLPTKTAWKPFSSAVLTAMRRARQYIYVENPYLFDKRVIIALVRARERGVDVRVVLPRVNDFKAGGRGNIVIANYLLQHGVRVYFYPAMTHVKALLVDGWACLGSANLNHLSLRVNQEQNVASSDPAFAARVQSELFDPDFARSYELTSPIAVDWVDFLAGFLLEGF